MVEAGMSEHHFGSVEALDSALAEAVVNILATAIDQRGHASFVVSGGSTPKGLFRRLATTELAWSKVTIILADERWVPDDHPDSNERLLTRTLLQDNAAAATAISLTPQYPNEAGNLLTVQAALDTVGCYDLVILGMGGDKHTASLFPCARETPVGLTTSESVLMTHPTTAPHARVTQSLTRLTHTRNGFIHIVGDDKLQVLYEARSASQSGEIPNRAPIAQVAAPIGKFELWYAPH